MVRVQELEGQLADVNLKLEKALAKASSSSKKKKRAEAKAEVLREKITLLEANFAEVGLEYRKEKDSHTKMDTLYFQWALSAEEVSPQPPQCPSVITKLLDMPGFDEEGVMRM